MFEYGEGDDDNALEDDFECWKGRMWAEMVERFYPAAQGGRGGGGGLSARSPGGALEPTRAALHFVIEELDAKVRGGGRVAVRGWVTPHVLACVCVVQSA